MKLIIGLVLTLALVGGCQQPDAKPPVPAYAVLTELGKSQIAMQKGANVRKFNLNTLEGKGSISYDEATGYVTLEPGTYRIDGYSITTFGYMLDKAEAAKVHSLPGYAVLWNVDEKKIHTLGSMQDPMDSSASHVNDVLAIPKRTQFYLAHQNGEEVDGVYITTYDGDFTTSVNHVFARLVIERID